MAKKKSKNIFKGLNIDRKFLLGYIEEFCKNQFTKYAFSELVPINNIQYRCKIIGDNKEVLIDFYFNTNGTTTIQPKVGKNTDLSIKLATEILKRLDYKDSDNFAYSVTPLEQYESDMLIEYLHSLNGVDCIYKSEIKKNNSTIFQFKSSSGDKITITYYANRRLLVQGKPLYLYQEVTCFLSQYFPFSEMIKKQSEYFSVPIEPEEINEELKFRLPTVYSLLDEQLKSILSVSLTLRKIDLELKDYSSFVFPALRALEGYIKILFQQKGIIINNREGFDMMKYNGRKFEISDEASTIIGCQKTCKAIKECYNYYHKHRHSLFHAETITSSTRIIETKEEADTLINDILFLMESSYKSLFEGA